MISYIDIESLGFKKYYPHQGYMYDYWLNGALLRSNDSVNFVIQSDEKPFTQLFNGVIGSKSELVKLLKQLGINA